MGRLVVHLLLSGIESCETTEPGVKDTAAFKPFSVPNREQVSGWGHCSAPVWTQSFPALASLHLPPPLSFPHLRPAAPFC